jgi:hypothetical protein
MDSTLGERKKMGLVPWRPSPYITLFRFHAVIFCFSPNLINRNKKATPVPNGKLDSVCELTSQ